MRDIGLTLGIVATSRKPNEHRLGVDPRHLGRIDADLRGRIFLERGYGERFDIPDGELAALVGGLRTREQLLSECDVVVLPKPLAEDLATMRPGRALWGWPHCVQDEAMTQAAIDRRLTLIAFEAMHHRTPDGRFSLHVFHKNNEMAGYCSVVHALGLVGLTGAYGPRLRAAVISFGATARGAVTALFALGVHDVTVLTHRNVAAVAAPIAPSRLVHYERDPDHPQRIEVLDGSTTIPVATFLAGHDIVVNCIFQDTDQPLMFVTDDELDRFARGTLFVDVSCDEGMGFEWARPTSFTDPLLTVAPGVRYYAVDHSPSYLWGSATWEISEALVPFLPTVMGGADAWTPTGRSARRSRSARASCRTRGSSRSRAARRRSRTPSAEQEPAPASFARSASTVTPGGGSGHRDRGRWEAGVWITADRAARPAAAPPRAGGQSASRPVAGLPHGA